MMSFWHVSLISWEKRIRSISEERKRRSLCDLLRWFVSERRRRLSPISQKSAKLCGVSLSILSHSYWQNWVSEFGTFCVVSVSGVVVSRRLYYHRGEPFHVIQECFDDVNLKRWLWQSSFKSVHFWVIWSPQGLLVSKLTEETSFYLKAAFLEGSSFSLFITDGAAR